MSKEFVTLVTPEIKKVRELKFNIYINSSNYETIIINRKDERTILTLDNKNNTITDSTLISTNLTLDTSERKHLYCIINSIQWILNSTDEKYKKFIVLHVYSNNIYITNLFNNWIPLWIAKTLNHSINSFDIENKEFLSSKPNGDLFYSILTLTKNLKINYHWIPIIMLKDFF